ncbi:MAG: hypothetical protein ACE5HN_06485 [Nitrospiria bacterium]
MIKRKKGKRAALQQDVVTTNRWGCGCVVFIFLGIIVAMLVAGYFQAQH